MDKMGLFDYIKKILPQEDKKPGSAKPEELEEKLDWLDQLKASVRPKVLQEYEDEAGILDAFAENYDDFVVNLFRDGYTHVGFGEVHDQEILHSSMMQLVSSLKKEVSLKYVCLELEHYLQKDIDEYLDTGKEKALDRVIEDQKRMIQLKYPLEGRITGSYFDIIRTARNV